MILLDTNVISALLRELVDVEIVAWLNRQPPEATWTTSITVYEIELGLALMPRGRRRDALMAAFALTLSEDLGDRVADLDRPAGSAAAKPAAQRQQAGRPVEIRDTLIAGIATRNVRHFHGVGVAVIDPWRSPH